MKEMSLIFKISKLRHKTPMSIFSPLPPQWRLVLILDH
ncbi:uncharacterized protein METZ01_LOCUS471874 [marine metagenome]|uniref:Uncharacterized protein n=1 Tax=marine metagenome TaxID=408172 RepID=A0A383BGV2_9ZZZZ